MCLSWHHRGRVIPKVPSNRWEPDGDVRVRDMNVNKIQIAPHGHFTTRPRKSDDATSQIADESEPKLNSSAERKRCDEHDAHDAHDERRRD
jgi:hypothetical protein